jgi:hypothetical protein
MYKQDPQMDISLPDLMYPVDKAGAVYTESYFRNCNKLCSNHQLIFTVTGFEFLTAVAMRNSKSQSHVATDGQSVCLSVFVSSPVWGS